MLSTGYRFIQWIEWDPNFSFSWRSLVNSQVLPQSIFPFQRISDGPRRKREVLPLVARVRRAIPKSHSKDSL